MSEKILVIAAHPDDETLGAGGSIARHAEKNDDIAVIILGEGVTSRYETREEAGKDELEALKAESREALSVLGVKDIIFFDFPDNRFDSVPLLEIIKKIEAKIKEFKPEIVYTHHDGDLNIDHRITFDAVMVACRPFNTSVRKILCFEVPSSTEWNATRNNYFCPNYFVDIGGTLDKKISALKKYKNEMRDYPHPRSVESVEILAKARGTAIGTNAAEAFELVRAVVNE